MPLATLDDLTLGLGLVGRLPSFLRRPLAVEQARAILARRFEQREADFLRLARRAVYDNAASPYRALLTRTGCSYGDLEQLVRREGLEQALSQLASQGVYLTVDEFKGRQPIRRGNAVIATSPSLLRNPGLAIGVLGSTSGSRGASTTVPIDLRFLEDRSVNTRLFLAARNADRWEHAVWEAPGGAITTLLRYGRCGLRPTRWFSQVDPASAGLHPRYRWSIQLVRWCGLLAGRPLPAARHVPLHQPGPVLDWLTCTLRRGVTPHLDTFISPAIRLCLAAQEAGVSLRGAQLSVTGEPFTAARRAVIEASGATVVPSYRTAEAGAIGYGCLAPDEPDEMHQYHDLVALVQADGASPDSGLAPATLLATSLRPTAPLVLLNVSLGDEACLSDRRCGCPLERLGWTTHLHAIRSREKLTASGMTFLGTDVIRVLEEVLPARFGGGPTDYQLVEEEDRAGRSQLRLLVHPRLGPLDPAAVAESLLGALGHGSGAERIMALQWRSANLVRVERGLPHSTRTGKILHLHAGR
jgi:hypothetical protein